MRPESVHLDRALRAPSYSIHLAVKLNVQVESILARGSKWSPLSLETLIHVSFDPRVAL